MPKKSVKKTTKSTIRRSSKKEDRVSKTSAKKFSTHMYYHCNQCNITKPVGEFSVRRDIFRGHYSSCKICRNDIQTRKRKIKKIDDLTCSIEMQCLSLDLEILKTNISIANKRLMILSAERELWGGSVATDASQSASLSVSVLSSLL